MDRTTLTRNLKPLEKAGRIRLDRGTDLRTRNVTLTDEGRAALRSAFPKWNRAQSRVVDGFGRERFHNLLGELRALSAVLAEES